MELPELLKKIGSILQKLEIPYVVTGGIAVSVWGRPRYTADIDIAVELLPQKLDVFSRELSRIGNDVYVDRNMMLRALLQKSEFNVIDPDSDLKIDFWILKGTPFDTSELERRVKRKILGQSIFFISPEDLILRKLLWHTESQSDKQLEDIITVLRRQKKLDWPYLRKWSKKQGTGRILKGLKDQVKSRAYDLR